MNQGPRSPRAAMARPVRRLAAEPVVVDLRGFAAVLSALLPGLGQAYDRRWGRAAQALLLPVGAIALLAALLLLVDPLSGALIRRAPFVVTVMLGGALLYQLLVVGDAFAGTGGARGLLGRAGRDYVALIVALLVLTGTYGVVYRQASGWAGLAAKIFEPLPAAAVPPTESPPPVWSGSERLNVLLLGIDSRAPGDADQNTDTMIVLTLDPLNRTAGMLSIPRDTLIDQRGLMRDKINAAYAIGGPDLARRAVEGLLGVPIHSWALINFDAFTKIVDGAGGVVVDVRRPLRDELYPTAAFGVQRVSFLAGPQVMGGTDALRYARTRHTSNDYERSTRQQDVLSALRTRLADAVLRIPAIMDSVGTAVQTSFDPGNVLPVARLGSGIDRGAIRSEVLLPCGTPAPHCELREDSSPGGFYLIPDRKALADLVAQVFYDPRVKRDAATIEVRGAGAAKTVTTLAADRLFARAYGVSSTTEGPAGKTAVHLRNGSKRATAEALVRELGLSGITGTPPGEASAADIVVTIGSDYRGLAGDR